ncbi:MAG: hypothetical protein P8Y51_02150 [Campylobacterales bacterium]
MTETKDYSETIETIKKEIRNQTTVPYFGLGICFDHVESGPLVRSSYKAFSQSQKIINQKPVR